jgi:hypothetical protein
MPVLTVGPEGMCGRGLIQKRGIVCGGAAGVVAMGRLEKWAVLTGWRSHAWQIRDGKEQVIVVPSWRTEEIGGALGRR